jgi:fluoride ion exporter CrcB/FEX
MIDALFAFAAFLMGFAAHQTDRIVVMFPRDWELLSRYIIGTLTIFAAFVLLFRRLSPRHQVRDAVAAYSIAAAMVGCGVAAGRWLDDRKANQ